MSYITVLYGIRQCLFPTCSQVNSRGPRSSGTVSADTSKAARANSTLESPRPQKKVAARRRQIERSSHPSGSGRCYPETLHLDHPTKCSQEKEANSSAEDGPGRRPNAFHHRANVRVMQRQSKRNPRNAGNQQLLHRDLGPGFPQPAPGDQAQDHCAQRRNETQCEVSTRVVHEAIFAREQVQEPLVEAVSEIVVLVPVRSESREVVLRVPRRGDAYVLPIGIRGRRGIQGPRQPVSEENQGERPPYPLERFHF